MGRESDIYGLDDVKHMMGVLQVTRPLYDKQLDLGGYHRAFLYQAGLAAVAEVSIEKHYLETWYPRRGV